VREEDGKWALRWRMTSGVEWGEIMRFLRILWVNGHVIAAGISRALDSVERIKRHYCYL
jgi:hypothetical protein